MVHDLLFLEGDEAAGKSSRLLTLYTRAPSSILPHESVCYANEPRQTLEEIDQVFSVPTKQFLDYELKTWLPYFVKRHILRKKIIKPPPIIEKAGSTESLREA